MNNLESINKVNQNFLNLCIKSKNTFLLVFDNIDPKSFIEIYNITKNPASLKTLSSDSIKQSKQILGKDLFDIYVNKPRIENLKNIFIDSLKKDMSFKKDILEALRADLRVSKRTKDASKEYKQTKYELIHFIKEKYQIQINSSNAKDVLNTSFGKLLNDMHKSNSSERTKRINTCRKESIEKNKDKFDPSNLIKKSSHKKVTFLDREL